MSRVTVILSQVRGRLADADGDRWTDADLIGYLNEAQNDICVETGVLRDSILFKPVQDIHTYMLPADTIEVLRAEYKQSKLPLFTVDYMDKKRYTDKIVNDFNFSGSFGRHGNTFGDRYWMNETTDGDIASIVYNKLRRQQLRIWPTPTGDDFLTAPELGAFYIPDGQSDSADYATLLGYTVLADYETDKPILIRRARLPIEITEVDPALIDLEVDIICDKAIRHYMTARAFEDDIKESSARKASNNFKLYVNELERVKAYVSASSMSGENHHTLYDGMGS